MNISNIEIIVTLTLSIIALILTIKYRLNDNYDKLRQNYSANTEKIYLDLLKVYTSKNFKIEALSFIDTVFDKGLNTTFYGKHHVMLMNDRKDNGLFNEIYFRQFAEDVERIYWQDFNKRYFHIIVTDSSLGGIKSRLIKLTLNILFLTKTFRSYLIFTGTILSFYSVWLLINDSYDLGVRMILTGQILIFTGGGFEFLSMFLRRKELSILDNEMNITFPQKFIGLENEKYIAYLQSQLKKNDFDEIY